MHFSFIFPLLALFVSIISTDANFEKEFKITSGMGRAKMLPNGTVFELGMDQVTGSGAETFADYFFGRFDIQIKLNSPFAKSTVTAFYVCKPYYILLYFSFVYICYTYS